MAVGDYTIFTPNQYYRVRERTEKAEAENARLKELNREMVKAMKWVLHLWQAELSHGADFSEQVQLDDAWENVVKVLAKAEEEGE